MRRVVIVRLGRSCNCCSRLLAAAVAADLEADRLEVGEVTPSCWAGSQVTGAVYAYCRKAALKA